MSSDPRRLPVIIGVGEICDRAPPPETPLTTYDLITEAVRRAAQDSGVAGLVEEVTSMAVVDALSRDDRPAPMHHELCRRLAIRPRVAISSASPSGNYPVRFVNDAADAISDGDDGVFLIAGGEAMRNFTRTSAGANGTGVIRDYRSSDAPDLLVRYGLVAPTDIYPLYEQATRHAWSHTLAEAAAESGAIWHGNALVAADNPYAWIRRPPTARDIVTPSPDNPMTAFPYTRMQVANSGVNQAAALLCVSLARARDWNVPEDRLVHIGRGASADEPAGHLDRHSFTRIPAMEAVLQATLERNGLVASQLDLVELYSCFPCIPKIARRIIDWPIERPHSIYGGLTFGGGPIGNCMTHALAALVRRIRGGSSNGLVLANGGFATRHHAIVLTRQAPPDDGSPLDHSVQPVADRLRGTIPPLIDGYRGMAAIETYALKPDGEATIVVRTPIGERTLALASARADHSSDPFDIGSPVSIVTDGTGLQRLQRD
jgi:acetyl-CoA C-acetyltransferase